MKPSFRWVVLLVATAGLVRAGEPAELTRLRDRYDRQARAALTAPLQTYARDLENLVIRLNTQRDLDGGKLAQQELDRVNRVERR